MSFIILLKNSVNLNFYSTLTLCSCFNMNSVSLLERKILNAFVRDVKVSLKTLKRK